MWTIGAWAVAVFSLRGIAATAPAPCSSCVMNVSTGACGGPSNNYQSCPVGEYCSEYGLCGNGSLYCNTESLCPIAIAAPACPAKRLRSATIGPTPVLSRAPAPATLRTRAAAKSSRTLSRTLIVAPLSKRTMSTSRSAPVPLYVQRSSAARGTSQLGMHSTSVGLPLAVERPAQGRHSAGSTNASTSLYSVTAWTGPVWTILLLVIVLVAGVMFAITYVICKIEFGVRQLQRAAAATLETVPVSAMEQQFSNAMDRTSYIKAGPHNARQHHPRYFSPNNDVYEHST